MSVKERDPLSGHATTGHEWDGITELNTRVPRAVWWAIGITHVWALIVWVLVPAWPLITTYTKGILGINQYEIVNASLLKAAEMRAAWTQQIADRSFEEIAADPALMEIVQNTGRWLYGDNCAVCHGLTAEGGVGFPTLTDADSLWGDDIETIYETLRVGINAPHPETRVSQMLAFGEGILERDEIRLIAKYLRGIAGLQELDPAIRQTGAELFEANCASCHGAGGEGNIEMGAPNLADQIWLYGGDEASLFRTIHGGRQGWMPAWEDRLSPVELKILSLYVLGLRPEAS
jgi:cytochrome c oxidase cbb3-type subunit III